MEKAQFNKLVVFSYCEAFSLGNTHQSSSQGKCDRDNRSPEAIALIF
nr:hypothetical protein [Nostoc sp. DedQUE07]MDZ8132377.1 hypothetical protein [Nostoc sp. DedQUE07]